MKRKLVLIAMAVMTLNFSGFAEKRTKKAKINFKTEKAGNFECTNFSGSDLVLFAGRIERNFILGGIKSNETRSFDLSKISEMPEKSTFIMRAVPYETYKTKERLIDDDVVYTRFVVFDLSSKEKTKMDIDIRLASLIKKYGFIVDNGTPFVVELRINAPDGTPIAALPPRCYGLKVYGVPDADGNGYQVFPTYIFTKDEEIYAYPCLMRDAFRLQIEPINNASFVYSRDYPRVYSINDPRIEGLQNLESVNLFGE